MASRRFRDDRAAAITPPSPDTLGLRKSQRPTLFSWVTGGTQRGRQLDSQVLVMRLCGERALPGILRRRHGSLSGAATDSSAGENDGQNQIEKGMNAVLLPIVVSSMTGQPNFKLNINGPEALQSTSSKSLSLTYLPRFINGSRLSYSVSATDPPFWRVGGSGCGQALDAQLAGSASTSYYLSFVKQSTLDADTRKQFFIEVDATSSRPIGSCQELEQCCGSRGWDLDPVSAIVALDAARRVAHDPTGSRPAVDLTTNAPTPTPVNPEVFMRSIILVDDKSCWSTASGESDVANVVIYRDELILGRLIPWLQTVTPFKVENVSQVHPVSPAEKSKLDIQDKSLTGPGPVERNWDFFEALGRAVRRGVLQLSSNPTLSSSAPVVDSISSALLVEVETDSAVFFDYISNAIRPHGLLAIRVPTEAIGDLSTDNCPRIIHYLSDVSSSLAASRASSSGHRSVCTLTSEMALSGRQPGEYIICIACLAEDAFREKRHIMGCSFVR